MIHRLHGIVCGAIHRAAIHDSVVKGCEEILHCHWVKPKLPDNLHWYEIDEHNGEIDLWTDHNETLVSIDVNNGFRLNGRIISSSQLERLLAAALAARMHRALWGVVIRGRRSMKYAVDDQGYTGDDVEGDTYGDLGTKAWAESGSRRSNARAAVGEDEYIRSFMEAYRRRSVGGHHQISADEVENRMRDEYRQSLAPYEGYESDEEVLFFVV